MMNPYRNQTAFTARPARTDPAWRYRSEPELLRAQDQWDEAETTRRWIESEQKVIDQRIAANEAAAAKAEREREDKVINTELERRYLSAGGDVAEFEQDLPGLRRSHAKRVALGLDQPLNSLELLKDQLRAARAGRNLGAPDAA